MMQRVLEKYKDVRQKVLLTEEAPDVRHFYEKNGFLDLIYKDYRFIEEGLIKEIKMLKEDMKKLRGH
ncbi:hypothetical protein [Peribacillus butanolivorans]|uniref:hypothetical protein n=1 Tax=Peribacillus butanolivorans TaxID=421767 RepID=UPI001FD260BB|nr:hypothetical protein [Peribacillus butanolivorans]